MNTVSHVLAGYSTFHCKAVISVDRAWMEEFNVVVTGRVFVSDDEAFVDDLTALAEDDVAHVEGGIAFLAGQEIVLTEDERERAEEELIEYYRTGGSF